MSHFTFCCRKCYRGFVAGKGRLRFSCTREAQRPRQRRRFRVTLALPSCTKGQVTNTELEVLRPRAGRQDLSSEHAACEESPELYQVHLQGGECDWDSLRLEDSFGSSGEEDFNIGAVIASKIMNGCSIEEINQDYPGYVMNHLKKIQEYQGS